VKYDQQAKPDNGGCNRVDQIFHSLVSLNVND